MYTTIDDFQQHRNDAAKDITEAVNRIEPEPCMNVASSPRLNTNLLNMGIGKHKLKLADYLCDSEELRRIATETRMFTRDGFA